MINSLLLTSVLLISTPSAKVAGTSVVPVDNQLQDLLTEIARQVIPHEYENDKHWGKQTEAVRGLYVRRDGWKLKTHRTKKTVNHGTWTRYRIEVLDPANRLQVRIGDLHALPKQRYAFTITCDARLHITGRLAKWQRGVQLVSLSAEATADVRLTMDCNVGVRFDFSELPPGLVIDPAVQAADLELRTFRLDRISRVGGNLAKRLSASVREVAEREIARRNTKLLEKINHNLEKNGDRFRLSLQRTLHGLLPARADENDAK